MLRDDDSNAVCIAFLRWRPLDLADLGRFLEIADIQNDDALIAVRKIGAVFVRGQVVQGNPNFWQPFAQSAVVDPVFTNLFPAGRMLPGKLPARHFLRSGGVIDIDEQKNRAEVAW